jgi:hypothetical protein
MKMLSLPRTRQTFHSTENHFYGSGLRPAVTMTPSNKMVPATSPTHTVILNEVKDLPISISLKVRMLKDGSTGSP